MTTTRIQLLGWIEHCEREHPYSYTMIPTWLCSMDAVHEAVEDGDIAEIGQRAIVPRLGMSNVIYGLTKQGRKKFYAGLPYRTETESARLARKATRREQRRLIRQYWADYIGIVRFKA